LLLGQSGYQQQSWQQPLTELPRGQGSVLILAEPLSFPSRGEKQQLELFLRSGGEIISAGRFAGFYLPLNNSVPDPLGTTAWKPMAAIAPSSITRAAPEITMAKAAHWRPDTGAVGLYGTELEPVVVEYRIGDGKVLWLAEPSPLTNAGLKQPGNLEFLLAAVGDPKQKRILWDEYVHGYQRAAGTAASTRVIGWLGLQLGIFAAAVLLAYSRRSGPIWIPQADTRLSPFEFVRTLGSLYENASAANVAVDISYQRFRYLLTRRLGLPGNASITDLERSVYQRHSVEIEDFASTLGKCESSRYDADLPGSTALHLIQSLFDYSEKLKLTRWSKREEKKIWKQS
jgi:hypothetical protein